MLRLIAFLVGIALLAAGLAWLADRPGELAIEWQGYHIETSVFRAIVLLVALVALALACWSILRSMWNSPAHVGNVLNRRRQKLGLDALSSGMIALGAGDKAAAMRAAIQARKSLPNEPLTHLLRAQAAQLTGDRTTARRIFEAMLASPDTEQLGLRGLFLEAQRERETEAARHFAERAISLNPKLGWAVDALLDLQCREGDWQGALDTLATARKNGHIERAQADRKRAVLLTAQAQAAEEADPERALNLALEA
ncbi:MAG: heme biosynthesis HemY N-terminal domain-containing protein, partial [Hyphomicrobium sp.]